MAVFLSDTILDAALTALEAADQLIMCAGEPADYTDATTDSPTGHALGEVAITSADFTKANGDTSGRKTTIAQQTGVTVDVSGTCNHIAVVDDASSGELLAVATCTSQAVTAGNTATINAFDIEFLDAS